MTTVEQQLELSALQQGTIAGTITQIDVKEWDTVQNDYVPTNNIIRSDCDWVIEVKWRLEGTLLDSDFFTFPGHWVAEAYLEGWGKTADELDLTGDAGPIPVDLGDKLSPWEYTETFTIVAAHNPKPGVYRLTVALKYLDKDGNPGPMAGFIEYPEMVQVFQPKK